MKFLLVLLCTSLFFMLPSNTSAAYRLKRNLTTATVSQHNTVENALSIQVNSRTGSKSSPRSRDLMSLAAAACLGGSVMFYLFWGVGGGLPAAVGMTVLGLLAIVLGLRGARGDRLSRLKPVGGISAFFGLIATLFGAITLTISANRR